MTTDAIDFLQFVVVSTLKSLLSVRKAMPWTSCNQKGRPLQHHRLSFFFFMLEVPCVCACRRFQYNVTWSSINTIDEWYRIFFFFLLEGNAGTVASGCQTPTSSMAMELTGHNHLRLLPLVEWYIYPFYVKRIRLHYCLGILLIWRDFVLPVSPFSLNEGSNS